MFGKKQNTIHKLEAHIALLEAVVEDLRFQNERLSTALIGAYTWMKNHGYELPEKKLNG